MDKPVRIYTDGVYDLLHRGHIESLKTCKNLFGGNTFLIVGVVGDKSAEGYKRHPIYNEEDRYTIIENIKFVDEIVKDSPLVITEEFLEKYQIDYVVHGFSNPQDQNKQDDFFIIPKKLGKFFEVPYYSKISTTDIIKHIVAYNENISKKQESIQLQELVIDAIDDNKHVQKHGGQDIYDNLSELIDDFSVTTNYLGPCNVAIEHIQKNVDMITHYPKEDQQPYKKKMLDFLDCKNQHLLFGNGATELIDMIIRLYISLMCGNVEKKYYVMDTQYMEYERSCILYGCVRTENITEADVVCIVNPCNPTGKYFESDELKRMLSQCKPNSTILIDESMLFWIGSNFRDNGFLRERDYIQKLKEDKNINLFILHSWSKIFSCTGIRVGTVLCPDKQSYSFLKKYQNPWNCNILGLEYIAKCIEDDAYLKLTWDTTEELRTEQINKILVEFPEWKIHGEKFLSWFWIELPDEIIADKVYKCSKKSNMPIRWGKVGYNKNNFVRVAVRKMENFDKLLLTWKTELKCNLEMSNNNNIIKHVNLDDLLSHESIYEESGNLYYNYLKSIENIVCMPAIIIDEKTNVIIDGHHRLYVLKKMGIKSVDVLAIDYLNQTNIVVNPTDLTITKEFVIQKGLARDYLHAKTTRHMLQVNDELIPIISLSKMVVIKWT
jgi:cytidyltransferase-like protein